MKTINQEYVINATPEVVWQALTQPKHIEGWGAGPATMDAQVGTEFSLWGGSIWGKNTEVIPLHRLVQDWYDDEELQEPTIVTFVLHPEGDTTRLALHQTNIPDESADAIEEGWKEYYLGPLKEYVEGLI